MDYYLSTIKGLALKTSLFKLLASECEETAFLQLERSLSNCTMV